MLQVVYEDEDIACIIKPQGIPTQVRGHHYTRKKRNHA